MSKNVKMERVGRSIKSYFRSKSAPFSGTRECENRTRTPQDRVTVYRRLADLWPTKIVCLVFLFIMLAPLQAMSATNLWILWGQSNMDHAPNLGNAPSIPHNVFYIENSQWTQSYVGVRDLNVPLSKWVGPELGFLRWLEGLYPNDLNVVLKVCRDGSSMVRWQPGGGLYETLLENIQTAKMQFGELEIKAVFGCQGERDSLDWDLAVAYDVRMKAMIEGVRSELGLPNLPWFIIEIAPKLEWPWGDVIVQKQFNLSATIPNVRVIPTYGLTKQPDQWPLSSYHWDTPSMERLGWQMIRSYTLR